MLVGVTVDVTDLDRSSAFYSAVLGVDALRRDGAYQYLSEIAPGVKLILQQTADAKSVKNRVHLELLGDDDLVEAIVAAGGTRRWSVEESDYALTVVADPDDNEFCIVTRPPPELAVN
jgi:catechol 2,3-dioxygenase-like lactoylglutathione lyase family enzyme